MISYWVLIAFDWKCLLFWNGPDFFLIGNNYSIIGKILRFIGNEVLDLNMCCQLNSTDSLDFHVNSVMIIANGWTQIASWVPNPLNSLTLIRNDVIFFSQCIIKSDQSTSALNKHLKLHKIEPNLLKLYKNRQVKRNKVRTFLDQK